MPDPSEQLDNGAPLVLRAITRLNVGGPARHANILSRDLKARGFRTQLVSGSESMHEGRLEPPPGVSHTRLESLRRSLHPVADVRARFELGRLIEAQKPDIVHTHLAKAGALGRLAARRAGVRAVVHTFHGHVLDGYFNRNAERAFIASERWLARRTDVLIAVSPQVRDDLLALGIGKPEQWRVIRVGLDLHPLLTSQHSPSEARSLLGIPDRPTVGIVGRLVPIKDHATFLDSAARVLRAAHDVGFVVAGDGPLRERLESVARPLGDRVRFLGWVDDLETLYAALDVVVLTSRNEGTPVALIEAGAAGKPVIATDVGGVPDVVVDGDTGHLVPLGDPTAISDAILALVGDRTRAEQLGRAARVNAKRFTADRLVQDIAGLYGELLS